MIKGVSEEIEIKVQWTKFRLESYVLVWNCVWRFTKKILFAFPRSSNAQVTVLMRESNNYLTLEMIRLRWDYCKPFVAYLLKYNVVNVHLISQSKATPLNIQWSGLCVVLKYKAVIYVRSVLLGFLYTGHIYSRGSLGPVLFTA